VGPYLGSRGGLAREQLTLFQALADRGHQVDLVYVISNDFTDQWRKLTNSMTQVRTLSNYHRQPLGMCLGILKAAMVARRQRANLIYVYSPNFVLFGTLVGKLSGTPVALWLAFKGPPEHISWGYRQSFRRVAKLMAVSQATAAAWKDSDLAMPQITTVLGAIDMEYYVPASPEERAATRASLGIDEDAFVVLFAGRIEPDKGVDVLVEAFGHLSDVPNIRLILVGGVPIDGHDAWRDRLRTAAGALGVIWLPRRPDVLPLIQMADVAVAPSVHEAFGRAVCEPLACGVPVIGSRVGGIQEILTGWLADYLVEPGDPRAIADKVRSLVGWRTSDPGLGARCREEVVTRLALPRFVDHIERELASVARPRRPRRRHH
jgi:glycosyltransferase involved in cell wall biosynthesis